MKFFKIKGDRSGENIEGYGSSKLRMVDCKTCSGYAQGGFRYPALDVGSVFDPLPRGVERLPLDTIKDLQAKLRAQLPYDIPVPPKASVGPYVVWLVEGRTHEYIRPNGDGAFLVTEQALTEMKTAGLQFGATVPVCLKPDVKLKSKYFEVQIDEYADIIPAEEGVGERCPACGFIMVSYPKSFELVARTIPRNTDLFRVMACPFIIITSERFRDFVTSRGYKGLVFQPVRTDVKKPPPEILREPRNAKPELWPLHQEPSRETTASSKATPEKSLNRVDPAPALCRKLPKQAAGLLKLSKPAIAFTTNPLERTEAAAGSSKTGGLPDLPAGFKWPKRGRRPLPFLAQFNLAELAKLDQAKILPTSGFLWFFYDLEEQPWGFDPKDSDGWSVIYADVAAAALKRTKLPKGLDEEWMLPEAKLNFGTAQTFPAAASASVQALKLSAKDSKAYQDCLKQPAAAEDEENPQHQLLGWPAPLQSADMDGECQLAANGINCGEEVDEEAAKVKTLRAGAKDWQLLLQLDSDNDAGLSWGDAGRLYFWIREQDLAARRFDRCWVILQCH